MPERIMAHLVAWYPDREGSLEAARALVDGGCAYLEVQFPFSDPTADGPLIQTACDRALKAGFRLQEGFRLVEQIRDLGSVPLFIMSYANPVFVRGVRRYLEEAREAGAAGVIVPDLPVDCDEGLFAQARALGLAAVPVVSPNTTPARLARAAAVGGEYLYATLRPGITGGHTEIGEENLRFLERLKALGRKVVAGFGVHTRTQVQTLAPHVHAVVVGSAFVREIAALGSCQPAAVYAAALAKMQELGGHGLAQ